MRDPVRQNDLIVLREDIPEFNLATGRIGRVLQVFTLDEFEVEFVDDDARTVAKIRLKLEQVTVLRHEATLDEATFWKLIEDAKAESDGDSEHQVRLLVDKLAKMSIANIFAFRDLFRVIHGSAYLDELWSAAVIICGGCSDDGFTDFRAWLIAQGKQVFYDALRDPEILVDRVPIKCDGIMTYGDAQLGFMNYVSSYAYREKMGEYMPTFFGIYTLADLTGEIWDEDIASQKYPKLAAKFETKECDEKDW
jgi:hypothetical protein